MNIVVSNQQAHIEGLKRSLSLVLQTMALNVLSLFVCGVMELFSTFSIMCRLCGFYNLHAFFADFFTSLPINLRSVGYLNSNLGFFVHCYYSLMYRQAALHVFRSVKKKLLHLCYFSYKHFQSKHRQVVPEPTNG